MRSSWRSARARAWHSNVTLLTSAGGPPQMYEIGGVPGKDKAHAYGRLRDPDRTGPHASWHPPSATGNAIRRRPGSRPAGGGLVLGLSRRRDDGRRVWWQAAAIGTVVMADGLVAYALGAPAWLALLYLVLGPVLAAGRVWLARRSSSPLPSPSPSPALPAAPAVPTPAPLRAIGYAVLDRPDNGELAEHTKAIKACCEQRGLALASIVHDVTPDASSNARPSLVWTLEQLADGNADVLVV